MIKHLLAAALAALMIAVAVPTEAYPVLPVERHQAYISSPPARVMGFDYNANPTPLLSTDRAAFGVGASYYVFDKAGEATNVVGLLPKAYVSYSLTPQLSLAASAERDFTHKVNFVHAGPRACVTGYHPEDRFAIYLGVDYTYYKSDESATYQLPLDAAWTVNTRASWVVWTTNTGVDRLYATAAAEYDPTNNIYTYRTGVNVPLLP